MMNDKMIIQIFFRSFDKDEDGKLSVEEMREIMVSLGEGPISEAEFSVFIRVNIAIIVLFVIAFLAKSSNYLIIYNKHILVLSKR